MTRCPDPLEWHPAYRDKTWLIDWLDGKPGYDPRWIDLPVVQSRPALFGAPVEDIPEAMGVTMFHMERRRCAGPAPYVGRPFAYEWWAGVDNLGRAIAGDSRIVYRDPPR